MSDTSRRYHKQRVIASGGMATVYFGKALGAGGFERDVAVKVMHPHIAQNPEFVAMFLDEARLAARIHHPNVVQTLDVDVDESGPFLVMDYVDGVTLQDVVKASGTNRLPIGVSLRVVIDTLAGLHAAHELNGADGAALNLVHRDVTPQNVLIGFDGVVRVSDFGVAHAESRLSAETKVGDLKGKIAYMAIEQLVSGRVDRRSDVYSAGILLWELLTGQRLHGGDNDGAIALSAAKGVTRSPRSVLSDVPDAIDRACMKALALDPTKRHATAADFAEALEDAAASAGVALARARQVQELLKSLPIEAARSKEPSLPGAPRPLLGSSSGNAPRSSPVPVPKAAPLAAALLREDDDGPTQLIDENARKAALDQVAAIRARRAGAPVAVAAPVPLPAAPATGARSAFGASMDAEATMLIRVPTAAKEAPRPASSFSDASEDTNVTAKRSAATGAAQPHEAAARLLRAEPTGPEPTQEISLEEVELRADEFVGKNKVASEQSPPQSDKPQPRMSVSVDLSPLDASGMNLSPLDESSADQSSEPKPGAPVAAPLPAAPAPVALAPAPQSANEPPPRSSALSLFLGLAVGFGVVAGLVWLLTRSESGPPMPEPVRPATQAPGAVPTSAEAPSATTASLLGASPSAAASVPSVSVSTAVGPGASAAPAVAPSSEASASPTSKSSSAPSVSPTSRTKKGGPFKPSRL